MNDAFTDDDLANAEDRMRKDADWDEEAAELERRYQRQQYQRDLMSLAEIVQRISDSAA